jgi:aminoglycoside phosphotransferase (APT) family kinase protein
VDLPDYLSVLGLPPETPAELRDGQFHDVVLTDSEAYRFPRSEAARIELPARAAALVALSSAGFDFAVPEPIAPVQASEPVGRCYLATTRVPGSPLARADIREPDRIGAELGRVLAALADATPRLRGLVEEAEPDRWERFAADVEAELFASMSADGRARARRELDALVAYRSTAPSALSHDDLGGDNLLWAAGPTLVGVIDWDGLCIGSPANDVASIAATYGWPLAERAVDDLPDPGALLAEARLVQATFALQQALPAVRTGDLENLDDGLQRYR